MKSLLTNMLLILLGFFTSYLIMSYYMLTLSIFNTLPENRLITILMGFPFAFVYVAIYNVEKNSQNF